MEWAWPDFVVRGVVWSDEGGAEWVGPLLGTLVGVASLNEGVV